MVRSLVLALALLAIAAGPARAGEWLAGDLHVHTTYSHDSYGGPADGDTGPEEAYVFGFPVLGQFAQAASRDLDFMAITDHNDVRSQADPGFGAFGVIGVPGYESSLRGHAQMLGATRLYEHGAASDPAAVTALAAALRADGGVFQINHPADSETETPEDLDWDLGYSVVPDTVEAWNGSRLHQPPVPAGNSHEDAIAYWEGWLDRGERVGVTGGSDTHWVSTSAVQGAGQPTTWVYARERTRAAVLDGLRAGRTTVSAQPPGLGGARLFLEVLRRGAWRPAVGAVVGPRARLRVRVLGAAGARVRVIADGGRQIGAPIAVTSAAFAQRLRIPAGVRWLRAEAGHDDAAQARRRVCPPEPARGYCRNALLTLAMTSATYVRAREPGERGR
jgi:hypothetical protein